MNKLSKYKSLIIIFVIIFFPFLVISTSAWRGFEEYGRLIIISIFLLVLPFWIIKYSITNKKKKKGEWEIYFLNNSIKPGKIFLFIVGISFIYYLSLPFVYDLSHIANNGIPTKEGGISYSYTPGFGILFKYQNLKFNTDENYIVIYSIKYNKTGENVKIWYLPNTKFVLKIEEL